MRARADASDASDAARDRDRDRASAATRDAEIDGFRFIRALASNSTLSTSRASVLASLAAAFGVSAVGAATVVARARSRTKAERDLPRGTHWRAAAHAARALAAATSGTAAACLGAYGACHALGVRNVEDLRRALRRGTTNALEAAPGEFGKDVVGRGR
jgi:hypothetical protein|tara:strand:+ start:94 stop:570 length:477 start_codon:yes stop_codon:yes gene_type:complete